MPIKPGFFSLTKGFWKKWLDELVEGKKSYNLYRIFHISEFPKNVRDLNFNTGILF